MWGVMLMLLRRRALLPKERLVLLVLLLKSRWRPRLELRVPKVRLLLLERRRHEVVVSHVLHLHLHMLHLRLLVIVMRHASECGTVVLEIPPIVHRGPAVLVLVWTTATTTTGVVHSLWVELGVPRNWRLWSKHLDFCERRSGSVFLLYKNIILERAYQLRWGRRVAHSCQ